jgi:hypothetical protein
VLVACCCDLPLLHCMPCTATRSRLCYLPCINRFSFSIRCLCFRLSLLQGGGWCWRDGHLPVML